MQDLNWKDAYSLGNKLIDNEHKKLFEIAQKTFRVVSPDKKIEKIKSILKELMDYTKIHFSDEEIFMKTISYPLLADQKQKHIKIISSMNSFVKNLSNMHPSEIEKELAHLVKIWFVSHIVYEDKRISQWINTHEIPDFTFNWKNAYSVHNELIDAQHQELFRIASEAYKKCETKEQKTEKIKETLHKLLKYFHEHFEDEEEYMKKIKYTDVGLHVEIHKNIIKDLNNLIEKITEIGLEEVEHKLSKFIEISLVEHIINEDKKIISFIKNNHELKEIEELKAE